MDPAVAVEVHMFEEFSSREMLYLQLLSCNIVQQGSVASI
jgi:hypothetical protein